MKKIIRVVIFLFSITNYGQQTSSLQTTDIKAQEKWVDSVMQTLSLNQKIGQLFMVRVYSNKDKKYTNDVKRIIRRYHIGGIAFAQGTPEKQVELLQIFQEKSKVPLLIGIDGEWGLTMRLKNTFQYPLNMTLGAIQDNTLIEQFGEQVGKHCKRVGVGINFAPVVDINTNPLNPVIGIRSFGEDKINVTKKAIAFTKGLQKAGIIATAKHFPGHGDTSTDSHKVLPYLPFNNNRLDSIELFPFEELIKANVGSVMVGHLNVPVLTKKVGVPATLSHEVVTKLLKEKMGFGGLVITDALNMKGATSYLESGDIVVEALIAGNDVLLYPENFNIAFKKIKQALSKKRIPQTRLDAAVRKILQAKYWIGLNDYIPVNKDNLKEDLITVKDKLLYRSLYKNAITLVQNEKSTFPIKKLINNNIAYVKLGDSENLTFINTLKKYTDITIVEDNDLTKLLEKLADYNTVIVGFHKSNETPRTTFRFSEKEIEWLDQISRQNQVILDVFSSPYSLLDIRDFDRIDAVLLSYQNSNVSQEISAQMIFGALETKGKLPVSIHSRFPVGHGLSSVNLKRLSYTIPEEVDMSSELLSKIDSVAKIVVDSLMAPGGQVLVARFGKVVYHKSFGYHTYDKKQAVKLTDLYDLASVTKILGGLPMVMKSEEQELVNLEDKLGDLIPLLKGSNKDTITLKEALSHIGKIKPWIPYYKETVDSVTNKPFSNLYRTGKSTEFSVEIADNLYMKNSYTDTIYKRIVEVPQLENEGYKYSGLIFYLFKKMIKSTYGEEMDVLNKRYFYKPLGANSLTYNPLKYFSKLEIAPTEVDAYYRYQTLRGHVHDMGAAMMNGVSGNAGLFSNSNDIAKIMQMYMQKGFYGGKRYLEEKTINKFIKRHYEKDSIRRGLGFDKPQLNKDVKAASDFASPNSFGHSGFTGTYTWADLDTGILYVFLSNRVYPTMENNKIGEQDIRTEIHTLIYEAILE